MAQQLDRFFGLSIYIVREIDSAGYSDFVNTFSNWLKSNPALIESGLQLYIHRMNFDIEPTHFRVAGIENRVSSLAVSVEISSKLRGTMRFINHKVGHRLWPTVQHQFGEYRNVYRIDGRNLRNATHFEEYLATVVQKRISEEDRKVKFVVTADATPSYREIIKNVDVVTKFDFKLSRDVELILGSAAVAGIRQPAKRQSIPDEKIS